MMRSAPRRGGVDRVGEPAQPADRAVELAQEGEEHEQPAEREVALGELPGAQPDHEQRAEQLDQVDERREERLQARRRHLGVEAAEVLAVEALDLGPPGGCRPGRARALARLSSATALIEPLRRRFSREACLIRREKRRAATQNSGATTQRDERQLPLQIEQRAALKNTIRSTYESASATPESTNALDRRDVAGQAREHVAEAAAIEEVEREALQVARRTWCAGRAGSARRPSRQGSRRRSRARRPAASGRGRRAAIQTNGPKSCGTSTSSTTTLNIQIIAVSIAGTSAISSRLSTSQRRYGRAYGQKRRKISRTGTAGEALTSASPSAGVENSERSRALSRRLHRDRSWSWTRSRRTPTLRCWCQCSFRAAPGSSPRSCRDDGAFCA